MNNTKDKIDPLVAHLQKYGGTPAGEEDPGFGARLLEAVGTLGAEYASAPARTLESMQKYLQGDLSGEVVWTGSSWIPKEAVPLASEIAAEAMGTGMSARLMSPAPPGSVGIFGGENAFVRSTVDESQKEVIQELQEKATSLHRQGLHDESLEVAREAERLRDEVFSSSRYVKQRKSLKRAKDLEESMAKGSATQEELDLIRKETGWFRPNWYRKTMPGDVAENAWRYEISDASFTPRRNSLGVDHLTNYSTQVTSGEVTSTSTQLHKLVHHDELFEAYPSLKSMTVQFRSGKDLNNADGIYYMEKGKIVLNADRTTGMQMTTLIHELQHAVQGIEGFARGSNWELGRMKQDEVRGIYNTYKEALRRYNEPIHEQYQDVQKILKNETKEQIEQKINEIDDFYHDFGPGEYYLASLGEQEARSVELRFRGVYPELTENAPPYGFVLTTRHKGKVVNVEYMTAKKPWDTAFVGVVAHQGK